MNTLIGLCIALLVIYSAYHLALLLKSRKMKACEQNRFKNGHRPHGSGVRHGMVLGEDGRSVSHVESKSSSWYSNLG